MYRFQFIKTAMTPFPYSIEIDESALHARAMMQQHDIRHLPVKDNGDLVNIISAADITLALQSRGDDDPPPKVRDLCVHDAYIVDLNERLDRVLFHMARHRIHSVVVTHKGRLAGIFTVVDACRGFAELLSSRYPGPGNDAA